MNKVEAINRLNENELKLGIAGTSASWHAKYAHSDAVYVGGIPLVLTEGDLLSIFEQYGVIVHVNLIRDTESGKSRGFAFLRYHDPRSAVLAVDNFNGAKILDKTIRVDHAEDYKPREGNGNDGLDTTPPALQAIESKGQSDSTQDNAAEAKLVESTNREERILKRLQDMRDARKAANSLKSDNGEGPAFPKQRERSKSEDEPNNDADLEDGNEVNKSSRAEKERLRREKEQRRALRAQIREERKRRRAKRSETR